LRWLGAGCIPLFGGISGTLWENIFISAFIMLEQSPRKKRRDG